MFGPVIWGICITLGIYILICVILSFLFSTNNQDKNKVPSHTVIMVKDHEYCMEGTIRRIVNMIRQNSEIEKTFVIVDMGSLDNTRHILEKFFNMYESVYVLGLEEYISAINQKCLK